MNKHLAILLLGTSVLQLSASGANANANASAPAPKAVDTEGKSAAAITSAVPSKQTDLYEIYAKDFAGKIEAAETEIIKALIAMGKPVTDGAWQKQKQPFLQSFKRADDILGEALRSKAPLKELKNLWTRKYSKEKNEWEAFLAVPGNKATLDNDLEAFARAWRLLLPGKINGTYAPKDFLAFAAQDDDSFTEPTFVNPDSPEGKTAAQVFADFGVYGTRFSIGQSPTALSCWTRSPHLVEVGPFFLTQQSRANGLLAAALAHEVHHIIFADSHHNSAIGTLIAKQNINPYRWEPFQRYKVLAEERAESLAAAKASSYLQGLLLGVKIEQSRGSEATECHMPYAKREALLLAIQKQLTAQEKVAAPLSTEKKVHVCNTCAKQGEKFQRCGRCKKVYYCSKDCQAKDWATHKGTCTSN